LLKWWILLGVLLALIVGGSIFGAIKNKEVREVLNPASPAQPINAVAGPVLPGIDLPRVDAVEPKPNVLAASL
jgi:hypothetical protein